MSEQTIEAATPRPEGDPVARGTVPATAGAEGPSGDAGGGPSGAAGEGPSRLCPACYAINAWARATCERCGAPLQTTRDFDAGLIWALDHPDTATAMLAARVLAERRQVQAIEPLARLARREGDPYRAAAAVRALRSFQGHSAADAAISEARRHPSVIVRRAAADPAEAGPGDGR